MDINSIIIKKRNKLELDHDEIEYFIGKYNKNEILEEQAAALLSYIYTNGLTEKEIISFINEVVNSGEQINLSKISNNIIDEYGLGVKQDKITLILIPIISALGIPVAKIFNKENRSYGDIIDLLSTIPGFNASTSKEKFKENISKIGIGITNQEMNLVPVDSKINNLKNKIACYDSIALITISLLSFKVATGNNKIIYNLTYGPDSYLKTISSAKRLGNLLVKIGKKLNKKIGYVTKKVNEPIGKTIGNNLEIQEIIKALNGDMEDDVKNSIFTIANSVISIAGGENNIKTNSAKVMKVIESGKAISKFEQMVIAQDGDSSYISNLDKFEKAKEIIPVYATKNGYISKIDCNIVGSVAGFLSKNYDSKLKEMDNSTGIVFEKKVGDEIKVGEPIAYVHSNSENKALRATQVLIEAYKISDKPIRKNLKLFRHINKVEKKGEV